jgi:hypothetical protein
MKPPLSEWRQSATSLPGGVIMSTANLVWQQEYKCTYAELMDITGVGLYNEVRFGDSTGMGS